MPTWLGLMHALLKPEGVVVLATKHARGARFTSDNVTKLQVTSYVVKLHVGDEPHLQRASSTLTCDLVTCDLSPSASVGRADQFELSDGTRVSRARFNAAALDPATSFKFQVSSYEL